CALWVLHMDRPGQKVLFDEPVLASTAFTLHYERELGTTTRAYPLHGIFTVLRTYLDKRPPLYPFVVALAHDLTGWHPVNAILVNVAATGTLLWMVWLLGRHYGGSATAGSVAVALWATFPEFGVCATGAGMDQFNLLALAAVWLAALAYARQPVESRATLLVISALLLTYCRYESVLYIGSVALVWLVMAWRERRWLPETIWSALPLGLLLYAWHNTVLSHSPELWELRAEQTQRFSLAYAPNNLTHAAKFLFVPTWAQPNAVLLSVAGIAGGIWLFSRLSRRQALIETAPRIVLAAVGLGIFANFALLMCYYWGELDDPIVTRLALPLYLLLTMLAVAGWRELGARFAPLAGWRWPGLAIGAAMLTLTVPSLALDRYSGTNLMRKNIEWERRVMAQFWPAPDLIITNRSPIVWLAEGVPSVTLDRARVRETDVKWHLDHHSFGTVLVVQRILTLGADGGWVVDEADSVPEGWKMTEVAVKRMGLTLIRLSLLTDLTPQPPVKQEGPPKPLPRATVSPAFSN
ncbi:MAG TPA: glycosyltransferase family 39 protein, partial [Burkholderiaceae bacterium]|nr:glycosyltransferase family 39 protein [Burkholderiaceae bacterium]